jgi:hypothetical protein
MLQTKKAQVSQSATSMYTDTFVLQEVQKISQAFHATDENLREIIAFAKEGNLKAVEVLAQRRLEHNQRLEARLDVVVSRLK